MNFVAFDDNLYFELIKDNKAYSLARRIHNNGSHGIVSVNKKRRVGFDLYDNGMRLQPALFRLENERGELVSI